MAQRKSSSSPTAQIALVASTISVALAVVVALAGLAASVGEKKGGGG